MAYVPITAAAVVLTDVVGSLFSSGRSRRKKAYTQAMQRMAALEAEHRRIAQELEQSQRLTADVTGQLQNTLASLEEVKKTPQTFKTQIELHMQAHMKGRSMQELAKLAREKIGVDCSNNFNIAVSGDVGTGKSNLIRVCIQLTENDPRAPKSDITECTNTAEEYWSPHNPRVRFWDLPGQNTITHAAASYVVDQMLYAFDVLIITYSPKLTATTVELVRTVLACQIPVVLVRAKADQDVANIQCKNLGMGATEAASILREKTHNELKKNFGELYSDPLFRAFVVSMRDFECGKDIIDEKALIAHLHEIDRSRDEAEA